ncbi:hypothetical protein GLOTRDRAFT_58450 [Gloeophyllum trabeum ATCC 11539]|uniref:General stress protein FMN-binding split barrel domain-containing protein n=1 Tax=Gloeophyllum trabeum (strain ATCC 11539 / FP-39264 / Madison 617) TaxID=670483 RepID=S7RRG5_GLOTA|nr:uncharacterized protein GLOTRDRAFT_58450 [Gloeophyllum trabeum ATCC 11539]EPQ57235.1 hypothetical protein GLOTRDRAFT_58450 [Gloeophyllum trabeum ATCC 11539]
MSAAADKFLDPYTAKAEKNNLTPQQKIDGLHAIIKAAGTGMLVTRSSDGHLHSRAMTPAGPVSPSQTTLIFIANNASHKFDEIQNDSHVNVSFYDSKTTDWVSVAGIAKLSQDKALIKKHWSSTIAAYFGDLKDGVHKGNEEDPRVSVIEVVPEDIRYWKSTESSIARGIETAIDAATGRVAVPGELIAITKQEIQLTQSVNST